MSDVEFFELTPGPAPDRIPEPPPRRAMGVVLALVVLAALIGGAALTSRAHHVATPSVRTLSPSDLALPSDVPPPTAAPSPIAGPPAPAFAAVSPSYRLFLINQICPLGCGVTPLTTAALTAYLRDFPPCRSVTGAEVVDRHGHVLGVGVHGVVTTSGVALDLTVAPARGAPPGSVSQERSPEGGMIAFATRRSGFDLVASLTFDGISKLPVGSAQKWLASTPLPS